MEVEGIGLTHTSERHESDIYSVSDSKDGLIILIDTKDENGKRRDLKVYFDSPITLAKKFGLRGVPTSIIFNKEGLEFARIIGSTNFADKKFKEWLIKYN